MILIIWILTRLFCPTNSGPCFPPRCTGNAICGKSTAANGCSRWDAGHPGCTSSATRLRRRREPAVGPLPLRCRRGGRRRRHPHPAAGRAGRHEVGCRLRAALDRHAQPGGATTAPALRAAQLEHRTPSTEWTSPETVAGRVIAPEMAIAEQTACTNLARRRRRRTQLGLRLLRQSFLRTRGSGASNGTGHPDSHGMEYAGKRAIRSQLERSVPIAWESGCASQTYKCAVMKG